MPTINIRWATNSDELKRNLSESLNQLEATKAGVERMVKALSGDKLKQAAHNFAAAVGELKNVDKLTNAERERGNALLTKALEKYKALGQQAPDALLKLHAATASVTQKTSVLGDAFGSLFRQFTAATLVDRAVSGLISFGVDTTWRHCC